MQRFSVEINNWGEWQIEHRFDNLDRAATYAQINFPQNYWRVRDGDRIIKESNFVDAITAEARSEVQRFENTERWAERFREQRDHEVSEGRRRRSRLREVAAQQRRGRRRIVPRRKRITMEPMVNWRKEGF